MYNSFFSYLQRIELLAFFSGYPLIYTLMIFTAGNQRTKNSFISRRISLLPLGYALVGSLYLGLQLKNLYPDYSVENLKLTIQEPLLIIWALLSILFWIPFFSKKTVISLIHSLVFFFFLLRDIFLQLSAKPGDRSIVRNSMKLYTDSLLLNLCAFAFIALLAFLFTFYNRQSRT